MSGTSFRRSPPTLWLSGVASVVVAIATVVLVCTAASIMLARDVPLIVVSRQLGHANPHITATIYAHLLSDSDLDLAARAFEPGGGLPNRS